jgi:CRP-like cAMP-binding protein
MISPELLRRFPFFAPFSPDQLKELALISDEFHAETGDHLFKEGQPAEALYLLIEGGVDLSFRSEEKYHPKSSKEFSVGEINPGEVFGISSLVEPYILNATSTISKTTSYLKIDAIELRKMMVADPQLGYLVLKQIARVLKERLEYTRVQLAAAWA